MILRDDRAAHAGNHERLRSVAVAAMAEDPYLEAVEILDRRGRGPIFRRPAIAASAPTLRSMS